MGEGVYYQPRKEPLRGLFRRIGDHLREIVDAKNMRVGCSSLSRLLRIPQRAGGRSKMSRKVSPRDMACSPLTLDVDPALCRYHLQIWGMGIRSTNT